MEKLKGIVFINQTLGMGGAENFNAQLLSWFRKKNVPVEAWTTSAPYIRSLRSNGVKTHKIPIVIDIIGNWRGFIKGIFLFPAALLYYGRLAYKNRKKGTILLSGFSEKLLVTPWAKIFNIPVVWVEHGPLGSVFTKFFGLPKFLYKSVNKLPDFLIVPSEHTRTSNLNVIGIPPDQISVIPSGINPLKFVRSTPKKFSAYCVSRMEEGKGQDLLIKAWPKVLGKFPEAELYLIGEGAFRKKLEELIKKLDLTDSIILLGWVKNLAAAISPITVGVFPSVWPLEGFGVVLLETMSLEKPVICFNFGPYPEIVKSNTGILVGKGNVKKLSDAIIRIFSNPHLAEKLGNGGRERFSELFTMDKIGPSYHKILLNAQSLHIKGNTNLRWQTYIYDLNSKGLTKFITDRIKKRKLSRKIYYLFKKSYVFVGKNKLYVNKMDTVVSEWLMNKGIWESFETEVFKKYLKKSGLVVDVGANIGYYTLLASRALESNGHVVAFEPASKNFNLLKKNVEENSLSNVKIEKKAVGSKTGKASIYLNPENCGGNRIYKSGERWKKESIETVTLDNYFSNTKESIDLLKIDIEGYELKAMQGAKELLDQRRIKVIMSELWPKGLQLAGDGWQEYIKYLRLHGFKLFCISDNNRNLTPLSEKRILEEFSEDKEFITNILAILK